MINKKKPKVRKFIAPLNCPFCKGGVEPHFMDQDIISKYMSERGKILGKDRTGLCAKHQRRVALQIKRARFIGLVPFVSQV